MKRSLNKFKDIPSEIILEDITLGEPDEFGRVIARGRIIKSGVIPMKGFEVGEDYDSNIYQMYLSKESLARSIELFKNRPVTVDHPYPHVTSSNINEYLRGWISSDITIIDVEGEDHLDAEIVLNSDEAFGALAQGKVQLSMGFLGRYVLEPGSYMNSAGVEVHYNGFFDILLVNHVALVKAGRMGPSCRVLLSELEDENNNWRMFDKDFSQKLDKVIALSANPKKKDYNMIKVKFGEFEAQVVSENDKIALENAFTAQTNTHASELNAVKTELKELKGTSELEVKELKGQLAELKENSINADKVHELVVADAAERSSLFANIKTLSFKVEYDEKAPTRDIKLAVLSAAELSEDYSEDSNEVVDKILNSVFKLSGAKEHNALAKTELPTASTMFEAGHDAIKRSTYNRPKKEGNK